MSIASFDAQIPRETDPASGLPTGPRVADPRPGAKPERVMLDGRVCRLEPLDPARHGDELYQASTPADAAARFLYLGEEPPESRAHFQPWLEKASESADPLYFAVVDKRSGRVEGRQTLMRIDAANRVAETGHIYWGPQIARSPVTTEANFLFARYVFETLGYRRFEWKCNALNAPSRAAALRFGFTYEGFFRRAVIAKGRTRDTTWFSMIAEDWPQLKAAYVRWLAPDNFDAAGRQRLRLSGLTLSEMEAAPLSMRRAATTDLGDLVALQRTAYAPNQQVLGVVPIPLAIDYTEVLAEKECWLHRDDQGKLDGALVLEPYSDHMLIWSIATAPAAQGQGLGNRLLATAEARARSLGLREARLYTGTLLAERVAWYQRHGYAIDRVEDLKDRSVTHMSKRLG